MRYLIYSVARPLTFPAGLDFPNVAHIDEGDLPVCETTSDVQHFLQNRIDQIRATVDDASHGQIMVWISRAADRGADWSGTSSWFAKNGWMAVSSDREAAFVALEVPTKNTACKLQLLVGSEELLGDSH